MRGFVRPSVRLSVSTSARVKKWENAHIHPCPPIRNWWPCIRPYFLIFSAINTYSCTWFDLTNKKKCRDWRQKLGEKLSMLTTFFLTVTAAITGIVLETKSFWDIKNRPFLSISIFQKNITWCFAWHWFFAAAKPLSFRIRFHLFNKLLLYWIKGFSHPE